LGVIRGEAKTYHNNECHVTFEVPSNLELRDVVGWTEPVKKIACLQLIDLDKNIYCCAKIAQRKPSGDKNSVLDKTLERNIFTYFIDMPKNMPEVMNGVEIIGEAKLQK
jgi:hypothetical protein